MVLVIGDGARAYGLRRERCARGQRSSGAGSRRGPISWVSYRISSRHERNTFCTRPCARQDLSAPWIPGPVVNLPRLHCRPLHPVADHESQRIIVARRKTATRQTKGQVSTGPVWRRIDASHLVPLVTAAPEFPNGEVKLAQPVLAMVGLLTNTPSMFAARETGIQRTRLRNRSSESSQQRSVPRVSLGSHLVESRCRVTVS